jgi:hypothetical protein
MFDLFESLPFLPSSAKSCLVFVIALLGSTLAACAAVWFWDPSERSFGLLAVGALSLAGLLVITLLVMCAAVRRRGA